MRMGIIISFITFEGIDACFRLSVIMSIVSLGSKIGSLISVVYVIPLIDVKGRKYLTSKFRYYLQMNS